QGCGISSRQNVRSTHWQDRSEMASPVKCAEPESETDQPRHNIRAVVVGVSVLKAVAALGRPSGLREIAAAAGMTPSRAHRYLASLVQTGLIVQERESGRYDLGSAVVELGVMALGRLDSVRLGTEALMRLTELTGLDSHLNTW